MRALSLFRVGPRSFIERNLALIALVVMIVVIVAWELIEFTSDRVLGTHVQLDGSDTAMDILLGALGALLALGVAALAGRKRRPA